MGWLMGILRIKWLPYAAILWATTVGGTSVWSYMKGKAVVEKKMAAQINQALEAQLEEFKRAHDADLQNIVHSLAAEQALEEDLENIAFPEMEPDCEHVMHDWLRAFNEAVEAASGDT